MSQHSNYKILLDNLEEIIEKAWNIKFYQLLKTSDNKELSDHQKVALYFVHTKSDLTFDAVGKLFGGFTYFDVKEAKKWCSKNRFDKYFIGLLSDLEEQHNIFKKNHVRTSCEKIRKIKKSEPERVKPTFFQDGILIIRRNFNYLTGYSENPSYTQDGGMAQLGLGYHNAKRIYS